MKNVNVLAARFFAETVAANGVTAASVANEIGVAQPTLSRMLKGDSDISIERLYALADALDVEVTDVLEYIEENQKSAGRKPAKETAAKVTAKRKGATKEVEETSRRRGRPAKASVKPSREATPAKRNTVAAKRGRPAKAAAPVAKKASKVAALLGKKKAAAARRKPM